MTDELPSPPSGDIPAQHSNAIKFSNNYRKMPVGWQCSVLLEVVPLKLSDLSSQFIDYDTTTTDGTKYPISHLSTSSAQPEKIRDDNGT